MVDLPVLLNLLILSLVLLLFLPGWLTPNCGNTRPIYLFGLHFAGRRWWIISVNIMYVTDPVCCGPFRLVRLTSIQSLSRLPAGWTRSQFFNVEVVRNGSAVIVGRASMMYTTAPLAWFSQARRKSLMFVSFGISPLVYSSSGTNSGQVIAALNDSGIGSTVNGSTMSVVVAVLLQAR